MNESRLREQLATISRALHARGWVAYHEGNVTARVSAGRILSTPTGISKGDVSADSLLVVDSEGHVVMGRGKPFSELGLHLAIYSGRSEVGAVVHAHPPAAAGFSMSGRSLSKPLSPEAVVALGAGIPTVPVAAPGPAAVSALEPFVAAHDAVLLANHGAITWGPDLEMAMLRMELCEQMAQRALVAELLGGARELPREVVEQCLVARRRAGLEPRGASSAVTSNVSSDLAALIRAEVARVKGG